jgi:uncharacterized phage-associated protein
MFFRIDTRKAIEASATLLRLVHKRMMDRKRLLALLFLADRKSLKETGRPIIGGKLVAMDWGPVHSEVYDLIKGSGRDQAKWSSHFENDAYRVVLTDEPEIRALSGREIDILNEVSDEYMGYGTWDVAHATHTPEYKKVYREGTPTPIPLEESIQAVGREDDKDAILRDAEEKAFFDNLFSEEHAQALQLANALKPKRSPKPPRKPSASSKK